MEKDSILLKRDNKVDLLRCIGLSFIILAHVSPPKWLFEIRSFDVVLMIFISGISYSYSKEQPYRQYIIKRAKRSIIPAWIYLIAYFPFFNALKILFSLEGIHFSLKDYVGSFTLISGIGLVWIFRVFFLMAMIGPLLRKMIAKIGYHRYFLLLIPYYILYDRLAVYVISNGHGVIMQAINHFVLYLLGYGGIYGIGIIVRRLERKVCLMAAVFYTVLYAGFYFRYGMSMTAYKYPPRVYYLLYGIMVSLILYLCLDIKIFAHIRDSQMDIGKYITDISMAFYTVAVYGVWDH